MEKYSDFHVWVIFQGTPCRGPLPADLSELATFPIFTASHFLSAITSTARPNSFSHQHEQIALPLFSARDAFAQATCCEPSPSIGRSEPRFSHCRLILCHAQFGFCRRNQVLLLFLSVFLLSCPPPRGSSRPVPCFLRALLASVHRPLMVSSRFPCL
jgi:hypothetical protein